MNQDARREVVRAIAEMGAGPFALFFLWSLFGLEPATVPQLEDMIRLQFTRPSLRTYLRKLQSVGLVSGNAAGVWVPSSAGKNFFSLDSSSRPLLESDSINPPPTSLLEEKNFFPPDPSVLEVLTAFGVGNPKRTELAGSGIPVRTAFNLAVNLMGECSKAERLHFSPGFLVHRLSVWDGNAVPLLANPYPFVHHDYCLCPGCSPHYSKGDPLPDRLNPDSPDFSPVDFLREVWKGGTWKT